jgi:hypothetical protein
MFVILSAVVMSGVIANKIFYLLGDGGLFSRYTFSICFSYTVFFCLIRLWFNYIAPPVVQIKEQPWMGGKCLKTHLETLRNRPELHRTIQRLRLLDLSRRDSAFRCFGSLPDLLALRLRRVIQDQFGPPGSIALKCPLGRVANQIATLLKTSTTNFALSKMPD